MGLYAIYSDPNVYLNCVHRTQHYLCSVHIQIATGSWSRGKVLDHRALGHDLEVRHWITDHWIVVWGGRSWSRDNALDHRSLGCGLVVRHWTTDYPWSRAKTLDYV